MKKKEFREPETIDCMAYEYTQKNSVAYGRLSTIGVYGRSKGVRCRIIRERDYQRLLRLAKGGGRKN